MVILAGKGKGNCVPIGIVSHCGIGGIGILTVILPYAAGAGIEGGLPVAVLLAGGDEIVGDEPLLI